MFINEIVKTFLKQPERNFKNDSSEVQQDKVLVDLTNSDLYPNTGSFFDDSESNVHGLFGRSEMSDTLLKQKEKIMKYRQVSMTPDVSDGLDEIVNEVIFSFDDQLPIQIDINEENEKLVNAITEKFNKILKIANVKRNLFEVVKRSYIDGIIMMHCAFDKANVKNGIKSIKMVEPCMLYFDGKTKTYKYMNEDRDGVRTVDDSTTKSYNIEELVREDFGLYDGNINVGYLEYVLKPANMLQTLEDLLIPLRFSRSISRRVFNVDIGDLPAKRGKEVMKDYQNKFKYKKFYNNETGEVSNQQHITSMVEDYWFSNRSGGKGTTVDVLDESGNLGELDDILYFARKLYRAMKIPSNRIDINPDGDKDYEYDSSRVTKEDMKFFMFISRIRQIYSSMFKEILKREVIATGIMSEAEWDEKEDFINISFVNENKFIEKMKINTLSEQIEVYSTAQEYGGKIFSHRNIMKKVFRMNDDEIDENIKEITAEKKDPKFKEFYVVDDDF
jgi:hypothetical protein